MKKNFAWKFPTLLKFWLVVVGVRVTERVRAGELAWNGLRGNVERWSSESGKLEWWFIVVV